MTNMLLEYRSSMPTNQDLETLNKQKIVQTLPGLVPAISNRWSPRSFSSKPVAAKDLELLFEAARWAASSYNEQPWSFIVATKSEPEQYERLLSTLIEFNQGWAKTAPVLMLTLANKKFAKNQKDNYHALHDTGAALANLMLQATELGLHAHAMSGYDEQKARQLLEIPDEYATGAAVAIGYLDSPDKLEGDLKQMEIGERSRRPLSSLVHAGKWGSPLKFN